MACDAKSRVPSDLRSSAGEYGPYDLILDSVGGEVLGNALSMLAPEGTCVSFGGSARLIDRGYTGKAVLRVSQG